MTLHRELPEPDKLLKPRDGESILMVPPQTWHCLFCGEPRGGEGAWTTVEWSGPDNDGPDGRCRECGQKYCLGTFADVRAYPALDGVT